MRDFWDFLKTTAIGGLFVILPAMLVYLVVDEMADPVVVLAKPITGLLFNVNLAETAFPAIFAGVLILATSFVAGLAMRSRAGMNREAEAI